MKNHNLKKKISSFFTQTNTEIYAQLTPSDLIKEFEDSDFTVQQVYQTLRNLDAGTAPDIDEFSNIILCEIASALAEPLTYLFNLCLKSGESPSARKNAIIRPVYKNGSKSHFKNYIPTSY